MAWLTIAKTAGGFLKGNWRFLFKYLVIGGLGALVIFQFKGFAEDWIEERNRREQILLEVTAARDRAIIEAERAKDALQTSIELRSAIDRLRSEVEDQQATLRDLAEKQMEIFEKHDLEHLARAKPGLIERRVNEASKARTKSIEDALNEKE